MNLNVYIFKEIYQSWLVTCLVPYLCQSYISSGKDIRQINLHADYIKINKDTSTTFCFYNYPLHCTVTQTNLATGNKESSQQILNKILQSLFSFFLDSAPLNELRILPR